MSWVLAEKIMGNCAKCDSTWERFCARYPDLFEETVGPYGKRIWFKDYHPMTHNQYTLQYQKFRDNCQVSGVQFADSDGQPLFICLNCLRTFLDNGEQKLVSE